MNVLRFGGKLVVMEQFNEALALDYIDRYEITHSQWVPTMFVRMLKLTGRKRPNNWGHTIDASPCDRPLPCFHQTADD